MVADFGDALPSRLLAFHLGNGVSLCAIHDGLSIATSMGYSPLSGLTMGTRSGDIDGAAVLRISRSLGEDETDRMLNKNSGLQALAGDNNMKTLLERDDDAAHFAVEHFCYWAARHAGSAIVAMGGLDAIAFTGGIGENAAPVRDRIMELLACFGEVPVHVVIADEEKQIARHALSLIAEGR
jgi:acetate kinase